MKVIEEQGIVEVNDIFQFIQDLQIFKEMTRVLIKIGECY